MNVSIRVSFWLLLYLISDSDTFDIVLLPPENTLYSLYLICVSVVLMPFHSLTGHVDSA